MRFLVRYRRVVFPLVMVVVCLVLAGWASPVVGWLLVMAAFGFLLDAILCVVPTTGTLENHRQ